MNDKHLKRSEKLQLLLDEEELQAIDDWRFAHRLPSRAAALRELLRRGLISSDFADTPDVERQSTGNYRVIDSEVSAMLKEKAAKKASE